MNSTRLSQRRRASGFTLMELMVVVAIMALLASLTLMGFRYAQVTSMRNRTTAFHRSIMSGLENYKAENGEYPRPKKAAQTAQFNSKEYPIGGSLMLYQAMSGDGDSEIDIPTSASASDGRVEGQEVNHVAMKEMPMEMSRRDPAGYLLVDGFGHPFQYEVPSITTKTQYGASTARTNTETINNTYDLWSFAEDEQNTTRTTIDAKKSDTIAGKWIKNW